jgi:mannose-6-phosphate isomerase-like protein (cupin superfamily)
MSEMQSGTDAIRGFAVGPGDGLAGPIPDVKASGRSTGGSLTVMEIAVEGGPPRHTHTHEDESLYLLSGSLDVWCGDDRFRAEPGAFVFMPRKVPHEFRSPDGVATALLIVTPGGLDEYFAQLHAAIKQGDDRGGVKAVQDAFGILRA